jgi:hypothetical protein
MEDRAAALMCKNLHLETSAVRTERSPRAYVSDKPRCRIPTFRVRFVSDRLKKLNFAGF